MSTRFANTQSVGRRWWTALVLALTLAAAAGTMGAQAETASATKATNTFETTAAGLTYRDFEYGRSWR